MFNPGKESSVEIDGKVWVIGRIDTSVILAWRDWIREQIGDPYEKIDRVAKYLSQDELLRRINEADEIGKDLESFSLRTKTAERFLHTETGALQLYLLLIRKKQPFATEDDAIRIVTKLGEDGLLGKIVSDGQGEVPVGNGRGPGMPRAMAELTGMKPSADLSTETITIVPPKS